MARKLTSRKRADIVNAAISVFGRKGFRDSSVKEIADTAGVSTATFYRYFRCKDDVYEEIVMGFLTGYEAIWQKSYRSFPIGARDATKTLGMVSDTLFSILDYFRANRDVAKVVFRRIVPIDERFAEKGEAIINETLRQLEEALSVARAAGVATRIEPKVGAPIIVGAVFGLAIESIVGHKRKDVAVLMEHFMEIILHGFSR